MSGMTWSRNLDPLKINRGITYWFITRLTQLMWAEQNLEVALTCEPISHPMLEQFFSSFDGERYVSGGKAN